MLYMLQASEEHAANTEGVLFTVSHYAYSAENISLFVLGPYWMWNAMQYFWDPGYV